MSARLQIQASSIRCRPERPATGEIWMMLGDSAFPAIGWNDFVVVILDSWIRSLSNIACGASQCERIHFMEGPHEIELRRFAANVLGLRALDRGVCKARAEAQLGELIENALAAGIQVADACRQCGDTSADAARLNQGIDSLRAVADRLTS